MISARDCVSSIWNAGLEAVRSEHLLQDALRVESGTLWMQDEPIDLRSGKVIVVGAGKAGAGMSAGLEAILGSKFAAEKHLTGWLNVPEDCVRELEYIHLHGARPAGSNEPTEEGVRGAEEILRLVSELGPKDLCIALISGGGSALLPAPIEGITLADKLAVTRHLSAAGANIAELNTVRKALSRIKGGGLARACNAGRLVTLIISDVLGDPLDVIASGPTVPSTTTPRDALDVLEKYEARQAGISERVFDVLKHAKPPGPIRTEVTNIVIGNNATAVDAAGVMAERHGYSHAMNAATKLEGPAEEVGRHLARMLVHMQANPGPDCLITGGEPTVKLAPADIRGKGGRNQQLVLAAAIELWDYPGQNWALLSAGTDGEDGPTDAAGAFIDPQVIAAAKAAGLDPHDHLRRNDAYPFFERVNALIKTGPTHTNVCDLRVLVTRGA